MNKFRQNYSQPKNRYNPSRNNNRREDEQNFNPDGDNRTERSNRPPRQREERYSADRKPYNNQNRNQRPGEHLYDKPVRLNRLIAMSGFCSRRKADEYIESGAVKVNGVVVMDLGTKVHPREDRVEFKGQVIKPERPVYIILNKPKNAITTVDDPEGRPTVMDFVKNVGNYRIFPVGRLDRNTTGILLMTNDGEVAKVLTHPSYEISKVYRVLLDKEITQNEIKRLLTGIDLEDGVAKIDKIAFSEHSTTRHEVLVQIHSGRNRVIRRMFEALGFKVRSLDRISFGPLTKKGIQKGRWRYLNPKEVNFLHMAIATAKRQIYATGEELEEDKSEENYFFPADVEQEEFDFNEMSNEGGFNGEDAFDEAVLDDLEDRVLEEDNRYNSETYQRTRETQQQKTGFRGRNNNQQRRTGGSGYGRSNNNFNQNRSGGYGERREYSSNRGDNQSGGYNQNRGSGQNRGGGYGERRDYNSNRGDNQGGGYNQNRGGGYGERRDYNSNRGDNQGGGYNQNRGGGYGERRDYNSNRGDNQGGGYNNNQNRSGGYGERRDYNSNRGSNDRPNYNRNESGYENRNRRSGDNQRSNYNDRPRTNYGNRNERPFRSNSEDTNSSSERRTFKRTQEQPED